MKRTVRLTESQLVSMIQKVVNEQSRGGQKLPFCYGKTWKDIGNKMVNEKKSFKIQNFTFKGFIENIPSQPAEFTDGTRTLTINPAGTWTLSKPVEGMSGLNQGVMDGKWKCLLMPGSGMDGYTIQLDKKIGLTESVLSKLVKRIVSEQPQPQQPTPNTKYMAVGTKFCFYGSCRVDIKVIDKTTSEIITSKGAEGADAAQIYPQVIKLVQDDLASKKITGVTLPTFEQLQDTSPKK